MRVGTAFSLVILVLALAASALAQTNAITRYTVVPVVLDNGLNSATSRVGDTFYTHCSADNCGGFPSGTIFVGRVTSVTRATGSAPGQIAVSFIRANLPGGTSVPINGTLTDLSSNSVRVDPNTGRLMGTADSRKNTNRFIAYGAGAGLVIGVLTKGNALIGALLGAAAGYLYGRTQDKPAAGRDVDVPVGSKFGVQLQTDVSLPASTGAGPGYTGPPPAGSGPPPVVTDSGPWDVRFTGVRPFMSRGVLMVPMRSVLNGIGHEFDYDSPTRTATLFDGDRELQHTVGSRLLYVNGTPTMLGAPSRIVRGTLYVPAAFINTLTGRTAYWSARTGVLRIQ